MVIKTIKVSLIKYRSAKEIVYSFFIRNSKCKEFMKEIVSANKIIHLNKKLTIKEIISFLEEKQKIWAYCRIYKNNEREIHYWFSRNKDLKIYDIASLFSHEVAHAIGIKSEITANKYSAVSTFILMILLKKFKNFKNIKV